VATKKITADNLQVWLDKLIANHKVFAPVEVETSSSKSTDAKFERIKAGQKPVLDKKTVVSPKGILFKQVEKLLSYERNGSDVKIDESMTGGCYCTPVNPTASPDNSGQDNTSLTILFGVRPCDARSFILTDKPFVHSDMPETAYSKHREHSAIITYACDNVMKTCFCTSTGGSPVEKTGDVWMMKLEDGYLVESLTPRGEELLALGEGLFADATTDDQAKAKDIGDKLTAFMEVMQVSSAQALDKLFKDEAFWKELTEKCLSCGACTFVCPTCYCFDVRDEGSVASGDRYRRWDSCMFFQYNRAAGGHNPRDMHWKRMRQRMLHKFCYFVENYGDIDCVGCGRCVRSCPVSYDIRDFIKKSFDATRSFAEAVVAPESPIKDEVITSDNDASIDTNTDLKSPNVTNENVAGEEAEDNFIAALPSENEEPFVCEAKIGIFDSNGAENVVVSDGAAINQDVMTTDDSDMANLVDSADGTASSDAITEEAVIDASSTDAPEETIEEVDLEEAIENIVEAEDIEEVPQSNEDKNNADSNKITEIESEKAENPVVDIFAGLNAVGKEQENAESIPENNEDAENKEADEIEETAIGNEVTNGDNSAVNDNNEVIDDEAVDNNVSTDTMNDNNDNAETIDKNEGLGTSGIGAGVAVNVFQWPPKETVSIFSNSDDADEDDNAEDKPGNESGQKTNENNVTGEGSDV
jgi:ferredoxin